jgi:hypothetical protein
MQTLLTTQPDDQPKRTFRDSLSAMAAIAAGALWVYQWLVFPAANIRKDLQSTGMALVIMSHVARARRHENKTL